MAGFGPACPSRLIFAPSSTTRPSLRSPSAVTSPLPLWNVCDQSIEFIRDPYLACQSRVLLIDFPGDLQHRFFQAFPGRKPADPVFRHVDLAGRARTSAATLSQNADHTCIPCAFHQGLSSGTVDDLRPDRRLDIGDLDHDAILHWNGCLRGFDTSSTVRKRLAIARGCA